MSYSIQLGERELAQTPNREIAELIHRSLMDALRPKAGGVLVIAHEGKVLKRWKFPDPGKALALSKRKQSTRPLGWLEPLGLEPERAWARGEGIKLN